jgi:hypothetical protein
MLYAECMLYADWMHSSKVLSLDWNKQGVYCS